MLSVVEVRLLQGWNRPERQVRRLQRQALGGDLEAAAAFKSSGLPGPWIVGGTCEPRPLRPRYKPPSAWTENDRWLHAWWLERGDTPQARDQSHLAIYALDPDLRLPVHVPQDYDLYAALTTTLCNRRGTQGLATRSRGLPHDASSYASRRLDPRESGLVAITHVTAEEILDFIAAGSGSQFALSLTRLGARAWAAAYGVENVRYLIGFTTR